MKRKDCDRTLTYDSRSRLIVAALTAFTATAAPALAGGVRLWPQAVVTDDAVMVRDVCRLTGFAPDEAQTLGDLVLADAPPVGGSVILSLDQVRAALQGSGANMADLTLKGAAQCAITRPQRIERSRSSDDATASRPDRHTLRQAVIDFFNNELRRYGGEVQVQFGRVDETVLNLTEPELSFDIRRTSGQTLGLIGLEIKVRSRAKTVQSVPLLVNVSIMRRCLVAAEPINLGQTVADTDLRVADVTFSTLNDPVMTDPAAAVGQRAKHYIAAGRLLTPSDLEPVPLVKRGQVVDVLSRAGGVSIVTAAKSLDSGVYGAVVELRSTDRTRKSFTAVVTGVGRVEIDPKNLTDDETRTQMALGDER